jgi:hypothetical protein
MTSEEEKTFLARFTEAAGAGVPVNIAELKSPYEEETRKPTGGFSVQANSIPKSGYARPEQRAQSAPRIQRTVAAVTGRAVHAHRSADTHDRKMAVDVSFDWVTKELAERTRATHTGNGPILKFVHPLLTVFFISGQTVTTDRAHLRAA